MDPDYMQTCGNVASAPPDVNPDRLGQLVAPPLFIVGFPRSGTTWMGDILAQHPEVARVHESFLVSHGLSHLFDSVHYPPKYSGLGSVLERDHLLTLAVEFSRRVWSHRILPHHRYLVEKSPNHLHHVPLLRELFPGARFVLMLRDGRDVCVSARAAAKSWAPQWREYVWDAIGGVATSWDASVRLGLTLAREYADQFIVVRYEDLHHRPMETVRRVFDFLGAPCDDALIQRAVSATDFRTHFRGGESNFRRLGKVGGWRSRLSPLEVFAFKRRAAETLVHLGYERDARWRAHLLLWIRESLLLWFHEVGQPALRRVRAKWSPSRGG